MRTFLSALVLATLPAFALAEATGKVLTGPEIAGVEVGVICPPEPVGSSPAPGTLAGTTHVIDEDPPFVSNTRIVPAAIGIGFGVKALATDAAGLQDVVMVVTHPPMGKEKISTQSFQTRIGGNAPSVTFYQFDYAYELVTGRWQMTAMSDDTVLYQASFDVVPPQDVPELAGVCGYENLLSALTPSAPAARG